MLMKEPRQRLVPLLVAVGLGLFILWWFGPGRSKEGSGGSPPVAPAAPAPPMRGSEEAGSVPERRERHRLALVDQLTGEPLGAPWMRLVSQNGRVDLPTPIVSGELWPEGEGWTLEYPSNALPEAPMVSLPWSDFLDTAEQGDDGSSVAKAPYASSIEGIVLEEGSGVPVPDATVEAVLVQPELWRQAADFPVRSPLEFYAGSGGAAYRWVAYDFLRGLHVPPPEGATHDDLLRAMGAVLGGSSETLPDDVQEWRARAEELLPASWATTKTDAQGRFSLVLPGSGHVVLHLWDQVHGNHWLETDTSPGETVRLEPMLPRRPIVEVVVYDEAGLPLSGQEVGIAVLLDPEDFDYDPHLERDTFDASAGIGQEGSTKRVIWYWGDADDQGRYRLVVPRALDYAATALRGPRYVDVYASESFGEGGPWPEVVPLVLDFSDARERPEAVAVFYGPDGEVLAGATVKFTVANDMPWVRQWPTWETDERGEIHLAWFRPGEFVAAKVTVPGKDGEADQVFYAMPQAWRKDLNTFHTEPASR